MEQDGIGLELAEDQLVREADAGARGLLIESIAEATVSAYRHFEIADASGRIVLVFDFADVLEKIACAQADPRRRYARLPHIASRQMGCPL